MQGKGRVVEPAETYSRIFQAPELKPYKIERCVFRCTHHVMPCARHALYSVGCWRACGCRVINLRNNDTGGKDYNPITGVAYEHFGPTSPERRHTRLEHPSITSTTKVVDR